MNILKRVKYQRRPDTLLMCVDIPIDFTGIIEYENGGKQTFLNGWLHSFNDEPADIDTAGRTKRWFHNGNLHRVGLPAVICDDGSFEYRLNFNFYMGSHFKDKHSTKQYWTNCWNIYRTKDNEHIIMAGLLSSANE